MPAALMWARGMERRTMTVRFDGRPGRRGTWRRSCSSDRRVPFSAPNLQYLMDSPSEFSQFSLRTFTVPDENRTPVFRLALHHTGTEAELDAFARDVQEIVREAKQVFREYPPFEGNTYTFIADYLPWANGDGMEHRNSTVADLVQFHPHQPPGLLEHDLARVLSLVERRAHPPAVARAVQSRRGEHVRRAVARRRVHQLLRPAGPAARRPHHRAAFAQDMGERDRHRREQPRPRQIRSAEEMSQMAPFVDAAAAIDRTNFDNTFISVLHMGRGDRARARSDAARAQRRPDDAGRLHARALAKVRKTRHRRRVTSNALHDDD